MATLSSCSQIFDNVILHYGEDVLFSYHSTKYKQTKSEAQNFLAKVVAVHVAVAANSDMWPYATFIAAMCHIQATLW